MRGRRAAAINLSMNKGLRIGLIAAAGLGAALVALPFLVPASAYKTRIEQAAERATGRKLTIAGPLSFTLYPALGLSAGQVALANVPGGRAPAFATAEDLQIGVRLLPLLGGRVEVTEIVLNRPSVHLEVDAAGHSNWRLRPAARRGPSGGNGTGNGGSHTTTQFSGIRIAGAHITYDNARTHTARAIDDLDATIDVTDLDRPARANGSFALSGRKTEFDVTVSVPRAVLDDKPVGVDLALTSDLLKARLAGRIDRAGTFAGRARIDAPSLRDAAAQFGAKVPGGAFSLDGAVGARDDDAWLHEGKLKLDAMSASGSIELSRDGKHTVVQADLKVDRLNLDAYSQAPHDPPSKGRSGVEAGVEEWNRTPLVLEPLRDVVLHAHIAAGAFAYRHIRADKTFIQIDAERDVVMLDLRQQMYGGTAAVGVTADLHGASPVWAVNGDFEHMALAPFLTDTIGVTQIDGTGAIKLDVTSEGADTETIMRRLDGKGALDFRGGRIKGVNFGQVARTIQAFLGDAIDRNAFTDYRSMTASFTAKDGVLASNNFQLNGPLMKTSGAGTVDVGNREIDFRIVPKATASLGKFKLVDIGVPFRIKGPWRHVRYTPDVGGIVSGILNAPLDRLLGDPKKKHKTVGDALKNMLGIH